MRVFLDMADSQKLLVYNIIRVINIDLISYDIYSIILYMLYIITYYMCNTSQSLLVCHNIRSFKSWYWKLLIDVLCWVVVLYPRLCICSTAEVYAYLYTMTMFYTFDQVVAHAWPWHIVHASVIYQCLQIFNMQQTNAISWIRETSSWCTEARLWECG